MMRRVYYKALLKCGNWEYPRWEWFTDLIDMNNEEEFRTKTQIEHMKNRLQGSWRYVPFYIEWKLGSVEFFTYEI